MRALLAGARRKQPALVEVARKLVQVESPSDMKAAVDACVAIAAEAGRGLDGRIKLHRQRNYGDVLEMRFGPRKGDGQKANHAAGPSRHGLADRHIAHHAVPQ